MNKTMNNLISSLFDFTTEKKIAKALADATNIPILTEKMEFELYLRIINTMKEVLRKEHAGE